MPLALKRIPTRGPASQSELRTLVARFPGPAVHVRDGTLWCNRLAERLSGYPNEEILTVGNWFGLVFPEGRAGFEAARGDGFEREFTLTMSRKGGARRDIEYRVVRLDVEEAWFLRDVTEAQSARRELQSREQELEVTIDLARLGTWVWDLRTGRFLGDAVARAHYGVSEDLGATYEAYVGRITPEYRARYEDAIGSAIEARSGFDIVFEVRHRDGSRHWLHELGRVVADDAGEPVKVIGATQDSTARKLLEGQLINAARMESLGRFAEGIAHDFNNILTVVRGHVEFLQRDLSIPPKSASRLDSIHNACNRARELIDELMELGRPMVAATGLLDLHAELEAMALALRQMMGESIAVELELGATRSTVRMERARFHAVVLNLATNARDAMPEGGVLHISTRDAPVSAGPPGDAAFIELTVSDTGTGMDAATAAHVFEPFFTTKEPGMGTGLGLAVTSSTIADAGGSIRFDSEPGSGTRFITLLPMAPAAATTRVELDGGNAAATGVGTVLLVEDEPDVLEVTADVVRTAGYRVVEALSAREAIDFVSSGERPDLLLTDVVMPEMTGIRLAERLSQQLPDLAVLFMSGYAAKADDAASVDPDRVLRKPFSHRQLIERVRRAIEQ